MSSEKWTTFSLTKTDKHLFKGWNTQEDCKGNEYLDGDLIKNLAQNINVVLYAQWLSFTIIDDYQVGEAKDDGIIVVMKTYDLKLKVGEELLSDVELEIVTWETENIAGFSKDINILEYKNGNAKIKALQSGVLKLKARYKDAVNEITIVVPGDINRNGYVNGIDASLVQKYNASDKNIETLKVVDEFTLLLADMKGDGYIYGIDVSIIQSKMRN